MLVVLIRTIIIYLCLLVGLRLMGKRTIGELQPFEFVVTLAVADVACMPMQDIAVPLVYGIVPLFVMFLLHFHTRQRRSARAERRARYPRGGRQTYGNKF